MIKDHYGPPSLCVYDNKVSGAKTIGYGFNMETKAGRAIITSLGLDYDKLFFNQSCLTELDANALLQADLVIDVFRVVTDIGDNYTELCCPVANALVDAYHNVSSLAMDYRKFRPAIAQINAKNYSKAADMIQSSAWCNISVPDCADDVAAVRKGC